MQRYIANSNTSVVPIRTRTLTANQYVVVSIPPTNDIGHIITVRDTDGHLSSPQAIYVSTQGATIFTGGLTTLPIRQGFGYITLQAISPTEWSVIDQNAFVRDTDSYSIRALTFQGVTVKGTIAISSYVNTQSALTGNAITITSSLQTNSLDVSSLNVNTPFQTATIYSQAGSMFITQSAIIHSTVTVSNNVSIQSTMTVGGPLAITGSLNTVGNNVFSTTTGTLAIAGEISTNYRVLVNSNIVCNGSLFVSTSGRALGSVSTPTVITNNVHAATALVTNEIAITPSVYIRNRDDIQVVSPTYTSTVTPVVEIRQGLINRQNTMRTLEFNARYVHVGNVSLSNQLLGTSCTQLQLRTAAITNSNGSLTVSSVRTNSLQFSTIYGPGGSLFLNTISSVNLQTSSIFFTNNIVYPLDTRVQTIITDTCSTNTAVTSSITFGTGGLALTQLNLSSMFVSSALIANQMSSFVATGAFINNSNASIFTNALGASTVVTPSIQGVTSLSNATSINLTSSPVVAQALYLSSGNTYSLTTSTTTATAIHLGTPLNYSTISPNGAYMTTSNVSGLSSNTPYEYITGLGTNYSPLQIKASVDRTVNIYFQNTSSFSTQYLSLDYSYRNDGSSNGSAGLKLINLALQSTILYFNASTTQTYQIGSLKNFPVDANPYTSSCLYYLAGPVTYAPPSVATSQNVLVAGGTSSNSSALAYTADGSNWNPLRFTPLTVCNGISWGYNKWIATGQGSNTSLAYSYSGTEWYPLSNVFSVKGTSVGWNRENSSWLATGEGVNTLARSLDGINWVGQGSAVFSVKATSAVWNGSFWLATGQGTNTIATSPDGFTWTGQGTSVFSVQGTAAAWSGSRWVVAGQGTNTLVTSTDGSTWTPINVFQTAGTAVAWNGSQWLAGSSNDTLSQVAYSANGLAWTGVQVSPILSNVTGLVWRGLSWLATGQGTANFAESTNGLTWTTVIAKPLATGICVANRLTVLPVQSPRAFAGGFSGASPVFLQTLDGSAWTSLTSPFTTQTLCTATNGSIWVAGGEGTYPIAYSLDGTSWTGVTLANMTKVNSVAWGYTKWIAVGDGSNGYTRCESPDGINWTEIAYTTGSFLSTAVNAIVWSENIWVAVGSSIVFSINGTSWITHSTPLLNIGTCIATNGSVWLSGGTIQTCSLAYSYNGAVWYGLTKASAIFTVSVNSVAWGNNVWVAVGQGTNTIAYSFDGLVWYGIGTTIFSVKGTSITWNQGSQEWLATGQGTNTFATSPDGLTWTGRGTTLFTTVGAFVNPNAIMPNTAININEPVAIRWDLSGVNLLSPSNIEKPLNTLIAWNARASSLDAYTDTAYIYFTARNPADEFMIGFSENPQATNSYTGLNFAFYITPTGVLYIYELGVLVATIGTLRIDDVLELKFTGSQVIYYQNSTPVRSVPRAVGNPLYLSSSIRIPGSSIDVIFKPMNQILETALAPNPYAYEASITPARDDLQYTSYSMPLTTSNIPIGQWTFRVPLSGSLVGSNAFYADLCVNSIKYFSTPILQNPFLPTPSTYSLVFGISTAISTTVGDELSLRFRTLRGRGESYFYTGSTIIQNDIYNLSSIVTLQFFHENSNSGLQTSEVSLALNPLSTNSQTYIDSNCGIDMNFGFMRWNSQLNGISIQNSLNDYQGRSITYSGALLNASDPTLKHEIELADISSLYSSIDSLPLRYYTFSKEYLTAFQPADRHQLGVLTTDVKKIAPSIIKTVDPVLISVSTLETVDRMQLRYIHLGATQALIQRISSLKHRLNNAFHHRR